MFVLLKHPFRSLSFALLSLAVAAAPFPGASSQKSNPSQPNPARWSETRANEWYAKQPWLVGANFLPSDASNEFEMWQAATFDPATIDRELGWAEGIGMNTMRVFLHDMLWQQDAPGFKKRIETFLTIASKHHIRPVFVLFDSCWDPDPKLGPQLPPRPGIHNSRWVQSPSAAALADPAQYPRLEAYVKGVVGAFAKDKRILAWDVWNEPANGSEGSNYKDEAPNKYKLVVSLLPQTFAWARSANPSQPLTSGLYEGYWDKEEKLTAISRIQLHESDVLSFHEYGPKKDFERRLSELAGYHRPLLCTEYMSRPTGSTFNAILPIAKEHNVAAINWGLVKGKMQTYLPWDSWQHPFVDHDPPMWFHDIFQPDGKPYRPEETALIHKLTGRP